MKIGRGGLEPTPKKKPGSGLGSEGPGVSPVKDLNPTFTSWALAASTHIPQQGAQYTLEKLYLVRVTPRQGWGQRTGTPGGRTALVDPGNRSTGAVSLPTWVPWGDAATRSLQPA